MAVEPNTLMFPQEKPVERKQLEREANRRAFLEGQAKWAKEHNYKPPEARAK